MVRPRTIATFFLALSAFVAFGAGIMLVLPHNHGKSATGDAPAGAAATSTRPAGAATPAAGDYKLVSDLSAIPHPGDPSRIVITSIGLDAKVTDVGIVQQNGKSVWDTAAFAVGFYRNSALPGTLGNTVMAGHISSPVSKKGDIFRHLPEVRIGDRIDVFSGDHKVTYDVSELRVVPPTAVEAMNPTTDATLTLLTCYPDNVYSKRLVVIGKLEGAA
jgi:sortase A